MGTAIFTLLPPPFKNFIPPLLHKSERSQKLFNQIIPVVNNVLQTFESFIIRFVAEYVLYEYIVGPTNNLILREKQIPLSIRWLAIKGIVCALCLSTLSSDLCLQSNLKVFSHS